MCSISSWCPIWEHTFAPSSPTNQTNNNNIKFHIDLIIFCCQNTHTALAHPLCVVLSSKVTHACRHLIKILGSVELSLWPVSDIDYNSSFWNSFQCVGWMDIVFVTIYCSCCCCCLAFLARVILWRIEMRNSCSLLCFVECLAKCTIFAARIKCDIPNTFNIVIWGGRRTVVFWKEKQKLIRVLKWYIFLYKVI